MTENAKLVLLRHGKTQFNKDKIFCGWTDIELGGEGEKEAREAGKKLLENGYSFDLAYTSYLRRAIKTTWAVLEEMNLMWLPVFKHWRLNERHYGALQGIRHEEMAAKAGQEQVQKWRRSFDVRPPALEKNDPRYPGNEAKYFALKKSELPACESLEDTIKRVLPYWKKEIAPTIRKGRRVLISAHGNSLRALVKHLDGIPDDEIPKLEIPTGRPLVYELGPKLRPVKHYYLE
ncbi:MAG: 2,3-diphosphoglycerate-dependent phosphoglycerate mutase [Candidatus Diapherotrites archaeon]|uniref:2,3-bisphosphoglycerate-dependent phosphoglycerate mutase n=1 Tax=Candidatus Iainarchaeum sp. TaxID=3101447 RepID=A0A8T3YL41_9ARCH|nr:2,3-diphosphoglycerate-dependent phosphoglycerate mutase [Candidatus Diapherotrites archaeon]